MSGWTAIKTALIAGVVLAVATGVTGAAPKSDKDGASGSEADLERAIDAFSGSWNLQLEFPPSELYPKGGVGAGTEVWRAGPGNITLTYEYHAEHPDGEMTAIAVLWWDPTAKKLRELWCTSHSSKGCELSTASIQWEGDSLVFTDSYMVGGRLHFSRELWSHISASGHTMTISESESISGLKPWIIAHATPVRAGS